ncbi:hypothetical protein SAMN05421823_105198 [Catalinimonas alkaloidigena]|uniref:Uncharacterized protein n=1 Tax=Catalinimonas alkaloidigena TaxID=1075417 RepID=A0A1G9J4T8_9BACT|nr:hypothetical protein [Catalinimonas alkaloidigena]SDL32315.1 hypothetical protein SAMN05421823_105198 [Catalinimonas alkaloidigena]
MRSPVTLWHFLLLTLAFTFASASVQAQRALKANIPNDLAQTRVLLLQYKFDDLMATVQGDLEDVDDELRVSYYKQHLASLKELQELFTEQQVTYQVVPAKEYEQYASDFHYVVRYTMACEAADDWSWCDGGFYFTDLGKNLAYDPIGMDKKSFKVLSKEIDQAPPALISIDSDPDE